ncbi:PREDICTED: uncharacterized protein LOC105583970 isoform X2 [Cercocebus atys]|uniref:uncharacterized protein LOC105583970 isoform X2 n=1 Tax=Cercocebus atys TaxID=9531 RepID=UPI0005F4ED06|nr:PREDICTED: uncharacterized protein LOC105583970 isoform X2 [Cercocebus atys]
MIEEKQQRPTSPQNIVRQRYFSCGFGNCLPCCHGYAKAGLKWLLYWHLGWGLTTRLHHFLYCLPLPLLQEDCKHPAWLLGIVAVPSVRLGQSPELLLPPPAHSTQSGLATCTLLPGLPSASRRHLTGCYCLSLLGEFCQRFIFRRQADEETKPTDVGTQAGTPLLHRRLKWEEALALSFQTPFIALAAGDLSAPFQAS